MCIRDRLKACATSRANRSAVPPAGNGTTIVTGRLGHACAEEACGDSSMAAIAKAMTRKRVMTAEITGGQPAIRLWPFPA